MQNPNVKRIKETFKSLFRGDPVKKAYSDLRDFFVPKLPGVKVSAQAVAPTPTPKPYKHYIPTDNPNQPEVPENMKQMWMEELDPHGVATSSAKMMSHAKEQTYTPKEVKLFGKENWNYGENPFFKEGTRNKNADGTYDLGMTQANTGTISEMLAHPYWGRKLRNRGISSVEDLMDTRKNLKAHVLQLEYANWDNEKGKMKENPSYSRWYAAPLKLRTR